MKYVYIVFGLVLVYFLFTSEKVKTLLTELSSGKSMSGITAQGEKWSIDTEGNKVYTTKNGNMYIIVDGEKIVIYVSPETPEEVIDLTNWGH